MCNCEDKPCCGCDDAKWDQQAEYERYLDELELRQGGFYDERDDDEGEPDDAPPPAEDEWLDAYMEDRLSGGD